MAELFGSASDVTYRRVWTWPRLLKGARQLNASDLHLVTDAPPAYRVGGRIRIAEGDKLEAADLERLLTQLLTPEQIQQFRERKQLCASVRVGDLGRFRVAVYLHAGVPEFCLRVCHRRIPTREELGLPETVDEVCRKPWGLVLVTGATGMGKTTTLNYMVHCINSQRQAKIIMLEDPVEFEHENLLSIVVQQEVGTDVDSFYAGLIHALRQDPDVIVVGEMRDTDTMETALIAAETGHLVLATLHTADVVQTIDRIVNAVSPNRRDLVRSQLAGSLQAIIAQRLLPLATGDGRVLACEVCIGTKAVRNRIAAGESEQVYNEMQTGRRHGMQTMDSALMDLYVRGLITYDTAITHARYPHLIESRLPKGEGKRPEG